MKIPLFAAILLISTNNVLSVPNPIIADFHKTTVDMHTNGKLSEGGNFLVEVEREDALVDIAKNGHVTKIADRLTKVMVGFSVTPEGKILANNNVEVPLGISKLKMHAAISTKFESQNNQQQNAAEKLFDIGIIGVSIDATRKSAMVDGFKVTRVVVVETVTEISGFKVKQSKAMQQVFEIKQGTVLAHRPSPCSSAHPFNSKSYSAMHSSKSVDSQSPSSHNEAPCRLGKAAKWVRQLSAPFRLAFSLICGVIFGLVLLAITKLFAVLTGTSKNDVGPIYVFTNNEEGKFLNDVKMMNDEAPPMYFVQKNGYTNVPKEEKD